MRSTKNWSNLHTQLSLILTISSLIPCQLKCSLLFYANIMWNDAAIRYFRRAVRSAQHSSFFTCNTLMWNKKDGRAEACPKNSWQFRNFQIYTVIMTLIVAPVFFCRTFQLLISSEQAENPDLKAHLVTLLVTDVVFICVPFLWFLSKSSSSRKLVICYEATFLVGKQIQGG